jgi:hypothetical protein
MEAVDILRVLARRKLALGCALLFAVAVGLFVQYQVSLSPFSISERVTTSHAAQLRVLLDAPEKPPTVDLDPSVADTLGLRAGLLADRLATSAMRTTIATRAGLEPSELAILTPTYGAPPLNINLAILATEASRMTSEPYVLQVAADPQIPIVSFSVAAPDGAVASRIAEAAVQSYTELVAAGASRRFRLSVVRLGLVRPVTTVDRMSPAVGLAATMFVFALAAAGIVVLAGLARAWRAAARPA